MAEVQCSVSKTSSKQVDPDDGWTEERSTCQQWLEFVLICLANIAWTIDASVLPVFFNEFQKLWGVSQTSLQALSATKGIIAALFAFPCGFMGEMLPRPLVIFIGMIVWAFGLIICGVATSFEVLFFGRILNGMGLGVVQPLLLSLLADKQAPSKRGSAFGSLFFTGCFCNGLFTMVATTITSASIVGVAGWRITLFAVALFTVVIGYSIFYCVTEPNEKRVVESRQKNSFTVVFANSWPKIAQLFRCKTFVLILLQGAPGTAPWTIFPNFTQWLELSCFTNAQTALIWPAFIYGTAFSNLLSGYLLNFLARRCPDHGPPSIANFSVAIGIPFLAWFFFILPKPEEMGAGSSYVPIYTVSFFAFGLMAAMCGTVNKKVFADIVPSELFTYIFAMDQLIEQGIGNLFPLVMGVVIDQVLGFDTSTVEAGSCAPDEGEKLGMGMFVICNVAWVICFSVYLGMHCTYPKDRRRHLTQQIETKALEHNGVERRGNDDTQNCGDMFAHGNQC